MKSGDTALEAKMTPQERDFFERYKAKHGKEFDFDDLSEVVGYREDYKRRAYLNGYDENVTAHGIKRWGIVNTDFNALWFDEAYAKESRWGGIVAPPLYLLVIDDGNSPSRQLLSESYGSQVEGREQTFRHDLFPNLDGALQADMEWEFFQPVRLGDKIKSKTMFGDIYWKQGKNHRLLFAECETTYTNQQGQLVARCNGGAVYLFK